MKNQRVLIVDNSIDVRQLVKEVLEQAGAQVILSSDWREAMFMLKFAQPDLVIMDIMMSTDEGFKFLEYIASQRNWLFSRTLVLTAMQYDHKTIAALERLQVNYMFKPFEVSHLLSKCCCMMDDPTVAA